MFAKKKQRFLVNEFTVFGVFIAIAMAGILYGLVVTMVSKAETAAYVPPPAPKAPTEEQYQAEARDVLTPFLTQTLSIEERDLAAPDPLVLELASKTQERLLRVRVPKQYREAHLVFVLLLDQWKRALSGSHADQEVVIDKTGEVLVSYPWVAP